MKYPATLSTALVLLALAPASVDASDGDAGSLLRSRTRQGNKNVFSNTISYSSEEPVVGKLLSPFVTSIVKNFNSCKDDWEDSGEEFVYCDIYFNPHTGKSGESIDSRYTILFLMICRRSLAYPIPNSLQLLPKPVCHWRSSWPTLLQWHY